MIIISFCLKSLLTVILSLELEAKDPEPLCNNAVYQRLIYMARDSLPAGRQAHSQSLVRNDGF
jgi:hypothetical protein